MAKILVSVQADQFTDDQIKRLEAVLRRNYAEHVTDTKVTVIWCVVPQGQFYTNYKLSRSSLISMECEPGFPQDRREQLLHACGSDWAAITGQDQNEVMLTLLEQELFNTAFSSTRDRLTAAGRIRFLWHTISSLVSSKVRKGYLSFSPNM